MTLSWWYRTLLVMAEVFSLKHSEWINFNCSAYQPNLFKTIIPAPPKES